MRDHDVLERIPIGGDNGIPFNLQKLIGNIKREVES